MFNRCSIPQLVRNSALLLVISSSFLAPHAQALDATSLKARIVKNQIKFAASYKKALDKLFDSNKKVLNKANTKGIVGVCIPAKGDLNMDGKLDASDLGIMTACGAASGGGICKAADLNSDLKVDEMDLGVLTLAIGDGGSELCSKAPVVPTPAPTAGPVPPQATATPTAVPTIEPTPGGVSGV